MTLIVLVGPTAVGKTCVAIRLAHALSCPIINCDSRQIYRGMDIGTAAPTPQEMAQAEHFFVRQLDLGQEYSAARYEQDVLALMRQLSASHSYAILSGGSMMYVDAVCQGIDDIPTVDAQVRVRLRERYEQEGLQPLLDELLLLDPEYYRLVDCRNHKRVIHALEICHTSGRTYTSFRVRALRERPFRIIKIGLHRSREELFKRINVRVDRMMADGFLEEVRTLYPLRHLNALNTIGYKEMFRVLDGEWELPMAVERMKKNTRVYAKKQMTWYQRDSSIRWFHPDDASDILDYIRQQSSAPLE
ncbi:MAG: tRNA (adenosine(37)-N6)-dimethylallyltransferase MiaA [Bacteroidaceae bacterium]